MPNSTIPSYISDTTKNNLSLTKSLGTGAIVGLTIGCFAAVIIILCVCFRLNRTYKFCSKSFWDKKKKESKEVITLSAVVTTPVPPRAVPIHDFVPKRTPVVEHVKPASSIHDISIVIPTPKPSPNPCPDKPREVIKPPYKPPKSDDCAENICKQYSKSLQLNKNYFNFKYNKCYCSECYDVNKPNSCTVANSVYTFPRGWTRFGLQIDEKFVENQRVFRNWCTAFYGTSKDKLESILNNRFIPFPGDHLLSGEVFSTHLSDKKHVYTSPSIHYASLKHVCPTDTTKINNEWYDVQIVLECKQNPKGIIKQQGCRHKVCSIISDNEIEWKTDQRSSIIPYGLLIRANKHRCTEKCIHGHKLEKRVDRSHSFTPKPNSLPIVEPLIDKSSPHIKRNTPNDKYHVAASVPHRLDTPDHDDHHKYICEKIPKPHSSDKCPKAVCKQYSIDLKMNRAYFDFKHNKCFCSQCYPNTKIDYFTVANSNYTVPRGWVRFGLQIDKTFAGSKNIFKQWCTAFYGTSKDKLESILNNRFIPFPGDHLLSGEVFSTHLSDKKHVYTSPSIHYASLKHVCPTDTTKINNEWYDVQIVLECKQNPKGIIKQQGCRHKVCSIISDNEIEWKTDQRSSIIPYGLLVRANKHRCTEKCSIRHS